MSKENIKGRIKAMLEKVRESRVDRLGNALGELGIDMLDLLMEATNGIPKPVLPPRAEEWIEPWEGVAYVICGEEPEAGARPIVAFVGHGAKENAARELARRQALPSDDDDHLSDEDCVLTAAAALSLWNSTTPVPRVADGNA